VLFRQAMGNHLFYAIASAGVLGIGGFLVIDRQLTLGQLVASELVVVSVLSALDKLIRLMEDHFDLLTGLDKVGHVTDLPVERVGGTAITEHAPAIGVEFRKVHFSYRPNQPIIQDLSLNIQPGERVALVGNSGAGKSTCANLICGLLEPTHGSVEVDQLDVRDIDLSSLRHLVDLCADANEIFDGTVEENIVVGREWLNHNDVNWALEMTQLSNDLLQLPLGRKTRLVSEGQNISRGQRQLILLARTIVGRPKFLILDDAFTGIPENKKMNILDAIYDPANSWTILSISHDGEVVSRSDRVYVLDRGHLIEYGTPRELAMNRDGHFSQLFPELTSRLSQSTKRQKG
jgi:ATP-binding cassette subfamily B protein